MARASARYPTSRKPFTTAAAIAAATPKRARPGQSVSTDEMARLGPPLSFEDLKVGTKMQYRGDKVPFSSTFLTHRGKEKGIYLLPAFLRTGDTDAKRNWNDLPGDDAATWEIVAIETGRIHHKHGGPLPDLFVIECSAFKLHYIGLVAEDVRAKFTATFVPSAFEPTKLTVQEKSAINQDRRAWQNEALNDGW